MIACRGGVGDRGEQDHRLAVATSADHPFGKLDAEPEILGHKLEGANQPIRRGIGRRHPLADEDW